MSSRSEKLYKELENIKDEYIEEADKNHKGKSYSDDIELEEKDGVIILESKKNLLRNMLLVAAILGVIIIAALLAKVKLFDNRIYNANPPEETKGSNEKWDTSEAISQLETAGLSYYYSVGMSENIIYSFDITGDGTEEKLYYELPKYNEIKLFINDKLELSKTYNNLDKEGSSISVKLADLYCGDNEYELEISTGSTVDEKNSFNLYYYDDKTSSLKVIKEWEEKPRLNEEYNADDISGKILFNDELILAGIGYMSVDGEEYIYDREKHVIEQVEKDTYNIKEYYRDLLSDLYVHTEASEDSEKILMNAQNVQFVKYKSVMVNEPGYVCEIITDGVEITEYCASWEKTDSIEAVWVYLKAEDGTEGWIVVKENYDDAVRNVLDEEYVNMLNEQNENEHITFYTEGGYASVNGEMSTKYFAPTYLYFGP